MTETKETNPLMEFSAALAHAVETVSAAVVEVRNGRRSALSGFLWRPGVAVTAHEGLGDGSNPVVTVEGKHFEATVAGRDPSTGIAVLKLTGETGPHAAIEPAPAPKAGELALAIGRREHGPSARLGIVSYTGPAWRSMRGGQIDRLLRFDINLDGRSEGGLLADAQGRAFGMAVRGPRRSVLAIPVSTVDRVAAKILESGSVRRGYLGVGLQPVRVAHNDTGAGEHAHHHGLMVLEIEPGGPAAAAGLMQGDIVTAIGGEPVRGMRGLMSRLGPDSIGQTVELHVTRAGQPLTMHLTVAARPHA